MFVEYETLNKITKENNSEKFFEAMKKRYRGEKASGPCGRDIDNLISCVINDNKIYVADSPIYRGRTSSLTIDGKNHTKISEVKSKLEKETGKFKLKLIRKGKG